MIDSSARGSRNLWVACALAAGVVIAGCTNPFSPEGTQPGVYKGKSDPLFVESADERGSALSERFELIQRRR